MNLNALLKQFLVFKCRPFVTANVAFSTSSFLKFIFSCCLLSHPFFHRLFLLIIVSFSVNFPNANAAEPDQTDIRIVIDISGSMKKTDPNNLRQPALKMLVELLPDGASAGVLTFGQYINELVPQGIVDDQWRQRAKEAANKIDSIALQTNLTGALQQAQRTIKKDDKDYTVILLTDGRIDMDNTGGNPGTEANAKARSRLFEQLMPEYADKQVKIHTLALSDDADSVLLQQVSFESEGLFLQASSADELMPAFLKAFDQAVPNEQVPIEGNQFDIDESVDEYTALIFRKPAARPTTIVSPSGEKIGQEEAARNPNVRWHHDLNFDLVTVVNPKPGQWQILADIDPNNRVQILSDLKLAVDGMPSALFAGADIKLDIALTNEDKVVTEPTILQLTDLSYELRLPDGQTVSQLLSDPEQLPDDGVFKEMLSGLTQRGEYRLEVNAVGRTFQRRRVFTASLAEPMRVTTNADIENNIFDIRVTAQGDAVDTTLSRVLARVVAPDGSSVINTLVFDSEVNEWHLPLTAKRGNGIYQVTLNIRGVSRSGKTFKSNPEVINVEFPLDPTSRQDDAPKETSLPAVASENIPPEPDLIEEEPERQPPPEVVPLQPAPEKIEPEPVPEPEPSPEPVKEEAVEEEPPVDEEESVPWWIYVALAVANLLILGLAVYWWLSRRRNAVEKGEAAPSNEKQKAEPKPAASEPQSSTEQSETAKEPAPATVDKDLAAAGGDMDINVDIDVSDAGATSIPVSDTATDVWSSFDEEPEDEAATPPPNASPEQEADKAEDGESTENK